MWGKNLALLTEELVFFIKPRECQRNDLSEDTESCLIAKSTLCDKSVY
jgi:hypothetical protein